MVSNIGDTGNNSSDGNETGALSGERRIISNHNIDQGAIRDLLRGALNPLPLSTVPTSIHISSIVVTIDNEGKLVLRCEVSFESGV